MAFIISVPPLPWRVARYSRAVARFSGVLGTGPGKQDPTPPSNVIRLNVSLGLRFSMHRAIVFLAVSMGNPLIDPLLSMTKIISFGTIHSGGTCCGGWRISVKKPPRASK